MLINFLVYNIVGVYARSALEFYVDFRFSPFVWSISHLRGISLFLFTVRTLINLFLKDHSVILKK